MLRKKPLGGKKFQVTFTMPPMEGVDSLHLCGEFNGWSESSTPMKREPDGSWSATLTLDGGKSYVFRYRDNRGEWHNDWSADAYVPNQFGTENSVLDLAAQEILAPRRDDSRPAAGRPGQPRPEQTRAGQQQRKPSSGRPPQKKKRG
ncbi:MAG TPA: isoamylase early set domain-containing protein [Spirochaetia bacterium]|nr:isoamylase early set domain-containing protein [Spirochaetia bacterium]